MSNQLKYRQQPAEKKVYEIQYSDWLGVGETIVDVDLVFTGSDLVVNPITILPGDASISYTVSGGLSGTRYEFALIITTDQSQKLEVDVQFDIRNIGA